MVCGVVRGWVAAGLRLATGLSPVVRVYLVLTALAASALPAPVVPVAKPSPTPPVRAATVRLARRAASGLPLAAGSTLPDWDAPTWHTVENGTLRAGVHSRVYHSCRMDKVKALPRMCGHDDR